MMEMSIFKYICTICTLYMYLHMLQDQNCSHKCMIFCAQRGLNQKIFNVTPISKEKLSNKLPQDGIPARSLAATKLQKPRLIFNIVPSTSNAVFLSPGLLTVFPAKLAASAKLWHRIHIISGFEVFVVIFSFNFYL